MQNNDDPERRVIYRLSLIGKTTVSKTVKASSNLAACEFIKGVEMNFLILLVAFSAAYIFTMFFDFFEKAYFNFERKNFYKSDLNRFQAKKLLQEAKRLGIESGMSEDEAKLYAICYCDELRINGELSEKYKLLKGT